MAENWESLRMETNNFALKHLQRHFFFQFKFQRKPQTNSFWWTKKKMNVTKSKLNIKYSCLVDDKLVLLFPLVNYNQTSNTEQTKQQHVRADEKYDDEFCGKNIFIYYL